MRNVLLIFVAVALLTVAALGVRGRVSGNRPLMLVPDMDFQARVDSQAASEYFADGRAMRTPPADTVPFGGGDYASDAGAPRPNPDMLAGDDAYYRGKRADKFVETYPLALDMALIDRGRERFNIYCAVCHGGAGMGNGITTKFGLVGVPNYHDERLRKMPVGEIYQTITNGKGQMSSYAAQVKPRDRWAIVAYVRALQRSRHATLADVPFTHRDELEKSKDSESPAADPKKGADTKVAPAAKKEADAQPAPDAKKTVDAQPAPKTKKAADVQPAPDQKKAVDSQPAPKSNQAAPAQPAAEKKP